MWPLNSVLWAENSAESTKVLLTQAGFIKKHLPPSPQLDLLASLTLWWSYPSLHQLKYSPLGCTLPCEVPVSGTVYFLICWRCHLAQPSYIVLHSLSSENIFCVVYRHFTLPLPNISFMTEYILWLLLKYLQRITFFLIHRPQVSIMQCCIVRAGVAWVKRIQV